MNARDVRSLAPCAACGDLGYRNNLTTAPSSVDAPPLVRLANGVLVHPGCISSNDLLSLPESETDRVRICDVPRETMKRLVLRAERAPADDTHRRCQHCNGEGRSVGGTGCCHCGHTGVVWDGSRVYISGGNAMTPCQRCAPATAVAR